MSHKMHWNQHNSFIPGQSNILHFGLNINRITYSTSSHIFRSSLTLSSIHSLTHTFLACCFFNISTPIKYCVYFSFLSLSISHTLTFSFYLFPSVHILCPTDEKIYYVLQKKRVEYDMRIIERRKDVHFLHFTQMMRIFRNFFFHRDIFYDEKPSYVWLLK